MAAKLFALLVLALNALVMPRFVLSLTRQSQEARCGELLRLADGRTTGSSRWACSTSPSASRSRLAAIMLLEPPAPRAEPAHGRSSSPASRSAPGTRTSSADGGASPRLRAPPRAGTLVTRRSVGESAARARRSSLPLLPVHACSSLWSLYAQLTEPVGGDDRYVDLGNSLARPGSSSTTCGRSGSGVSPGWRSRARPRRGARPLGLRIASATTCPFFGPFAFAALVRSSSSRAVRGDQLVPRQLALHPLPLAGGSRAPPRAPARAAPSALTAGALLYTVGMGVDYVRLDRRLDALHGRHAARSRRGEAPAAALPQQGQRARTRGACCTRGAST